MVLTTVIMWPHLKELERTAWVVHYEECATRAHRNTMLLSSGLCDLGENELALRDKVNCALARTENAWGIWVCAVESRFRNHSVSVIAQHLWASWYVSGALVLFTIHVIRGWFSHRTDVERHRISMAQFGEVFAEQRRQLNHGVHQYRHSQLERGRDVDRGRKYGHYIAAGE